MKGLYRLVGILFTSILLVSCGGGGGGSVGSPTPKQIVVGQPIASLAYTGNKTLTVSWSTVINADYYRVYENADGLSGFSDISNELSADTLTYQFEAPLFARVNAQYKLEACSRAGACNESEVMAVDAQGLASSVVYLKGDNTEKSDAFGTDVSISDDGLTMAVGAHWEHSTSRVINEGKGIDNSERVGAVYVFVKDGLQWKQQAYIKSENLDLRDTFGFSVSLSGDGNLLAVGAMFEDGDGDDPSSNSVEDSGAAYLFGRVDGVWQQKAYLKANNPSAGDLFGESVWLSDDGQTLAVGALKEDSPAIKINDYENQGDGDPEIEGDSFDPLSSDYGAVYIFTLKEGTWKQQAYIKPDRKILYGAFGSSVELSANGNTLVVGSGNPFFGGEKTSQSYMYIYSRTGSEWQLDKAYLPGSSTVAPQYNHVAISADGTVAASSFMSPGNDIVVTLLTKSGSEWSSYELLPVLYESTRGVSQPGEIDMNSDGTVLAIGVPRNHSCDPGFNGARSGDCVDSGAVFVLQGSGTDWKETFIKSLDLRGVGDQDSKQRDEFGRRLSLSGDGQVLAVGSIWEDNSSRSGSFKLDDNASDAGAVYIY